MVGWCVLMMTAGCGGSQPDGQTAADQKTESAPNEAAEPGAGAPVAEREPIEVPLREPAEGEEAGDKEAASGDEGYDESGDEGFGEF